MTQLSAAGAADLSRTRDGQVSPYRVSHTDPATYADDMKADHALGAIDDNVVRLAIVASGATLAQIEAPKFVPGGNRDAFGYSAKYVSSSYFRRGLLVTLSIYCGVSFTAAQEPRGPAEELTRACALKIQETANRVKAAIKACPGLVQRGGGVYVDDSGDPWLAHYLASIESVPAEVCATCGKRIYFANNDWRHEDTKRAEALTPERRIDHVADPLQAGRKS